MHTGTMNPEDSSVIPYILTYLLSQTPDSASPQLRPESLSALPVTPAEKRDLSGNNEEPWTGKCSDYSRPPPHIGITLLQCGHEASGWGVPPDHFVPGGLKLGACRGAALTAGGEVPCRAHRSPGSGTWCLERSREGFWGEGDGDEHSEDSECCVCASPALLSAQLLGDPGREAARQKGPSHRKQPSVAAPALVLPTGSSPARSPGGLLLSSPLYMHAAASHPHFLPQSETHKQLVQNWRSARYWALSKGFPFGCEEMFAEWGLWRVKEHILIEINGPDRLGVSPFSN